MQAGRLPRPINPRLVIHAPLQNELYKYIQIAIYTYIRWKESGEDERWGRIITTNVSTSRRHYKCRSSSFRSRPASARDTFSCLVRLLLLNLDRALRHFWQSRFSFTSIDRCNSTLPYEKFSSPESFVQSSSWILSAASRLEGEGKSPPLCSPGKNLIPFLLTRSFVEYSPRFPRDSFSFLPSLRFSFILFSSIDQASNCCWCETRKFLDDRLTARVIFRFFIPYDFEFLFFFCQFHLEKKEKKKSSNQTERVKY